MGVIGIAVPLISSLAEDVAEGEDIDDIIVKCCGGVFASWRLKSSMCSVSGSASMISFMMLMSGKSG